MKKLFSLAVVCGLFISAPAHASDVRMDDIVISANKIETSASEATSSVTVITDEDMEAQQTRSLVDALKTAPGVFMGNDYTDITGLRQTAKLDMSRYEEGVIVETIDGGIVNQLNITFNEDGDPVLITNSSGHSMEVTW